MLVEKIRKPIRTSVKKEIYERSGGKCQRCGLPIKWGSKKGVFHHTRSPSISPTAKTVQFLCQNCHVEHGHSYKTVTHTNLFGFKNKETRIERKKVRKKRTSKASGRKAKKRSSRK
ncbi:MAG: hypothetical protein FJW69_09520 [Actinobacteria bacterium]|nr:hypothetical protein [Actinomycetota bacterium]